VPAPRTSSEETRPNWKDVLAIAVLALACLLSRVPSLDRIALNPDESQYEASASYLAATGSSAFAFPYGTPGTVTLYKLIATVFGPYSMFEVRLLVLLICLTMAMLLYELVQRESNRWWGLASGLLFVYFNPSFEGWTANREWFSGLWVLVGILIYALSLRRVSHRRWWMLLAAGVACGMSLWFKRQASFLVLVIPLMLVWESLEERKPAELLRRLLPYVLGGIAATALFLLPFLFHGTLGVYLGSIFEDWSLFVAGNEAMTQQMAGDTTDLYAVRLYWGLPHRAILLIAYGFALVCLVGAGLRLAGKRPRWWPAQDRPIVLLFAVYLVAALLCVKLGNRFFGHYYLFLLPPVAGLFGFAGHCLGASRRSDAVRWFGVGFAVLFVVDRVIALRLTPLGAVLGDWPRSIVPWLYLAAGVAIIGYGLMRPLRRAGRTIAALLILELGLLVVQAQLTAPPPSLPHHPRGFARLEARIEALAGPDDLLFVWGWLPEIYSLMRLESASHMTITEYVVEDYYVTPQGPTINRPMAEMMMDDLRTRKPKFIVDAAKRSWTMVADGNPWLYRLDQYPEFELVQLLQTDYDLVGTYDDCDLYVRR
jgi:4-amino-4-deoxy-L-arabinose transferase-like glycosyltransferase